MTDLSSASVVVEIGAARHEEIPLSGKTQKALRLFFSMRRVIAFYPIQPRRGKHFHERLPRIAVSPLYVFPFLCGKRGKARGDILGQKEDLCGVCEHGDPARLVDDFEGIEGPMSENPLPPGAKTLR